MIHMKVQGLTIDPATNSPILILQELTGERTLPIWIGLLEATAIASELEKVSFSRPMTHDLALNLISHMGRKILKVEITALKDNTFYALLHLQEDQGVTTVDSRPSDAIALALRADAPILVAEEVLTTAAASPATGQARGDKERKDLLESMDPDDFGKYKM
ncbi:MAG: bifunctional nuclease family protein [Proteobacteria bacterium]|nr:bifunctional nuclease family protein [Pseudomonadota bacterium]MBU4275180.1 bifunctional nuclease family protein [Pseudomonadota bacterium]MBU4383058.1 bifunctional nuclease family protein [Pseudomonadota bacterium]MBU4606562.1 bifunctional nuclease family protein [Pseudomonadota bacterium]MCG2762838.1 bifunctional nuclease family protein [Desulfarculaceae bacterium]